MDCYKVCENRLKVIRGHLCRENYIKFRRQLLNLTLSHRKGLVNVSSSEDILYKVLRRAKKNSSNFNKEIVASLVKNLCNVATVYKGISVNKSSGSSSDLPIEAETGRAISGGLEKILKSVKETKRFVEGEIELLASINDSREAQISLNTNPSIFDTFNDGFYKLKVSIPTNIDQTEPLPATATDFSDVIDHYCRDVRPVLKIGADVTVLNGSKRRTQAPDPTFLKTPKNLHIKHLINSKDLHCSDRRIVAREHDQVTRQADQVALARPRLVPCVGALYEPLHSFKSNRMTEFRPTDHSRYIRQVEAKNLDKQPLYVPSSLELPMALIGRGLDRNGCRKEISLVREAFHCGESSCRREFVVSIADGTATVSKCVTYVGSVHLTEEESRKSVAKSFVLDDVVNGNFKKRILHKLMSYEAGMRKLASEVRCNVDTINKIQKSISWGCLWQNWHFFNTNMVDELAFLRELSRIPDASTPLNTDNEICKLRKLTTEFILELEDLKATYNSSGEVDLKRVQDLISHYHTNIISAYNDHTPKLISEIRGEAKTPHKIATKEQGKRRTDFNEFINIAEGKDDDLNQLRSELLPRHVRDAQTASTLTNLESILDLTVLGDDFDVKPAKTFGTKALMSYTVADIQKSVDIMFNEPELMSKCLRALRVLEILISSVKGKGREYSNLKELHNSHLKTCRIPYDVTLWIVNKFYTKSNSNYALDSKGYQKVMCYIMWLCIYISSLAKPSGKGKGHIYDFGILLNIDFKNNRMMQFLFNKCVVIASLVRVGKKANVYKLQVPLITEPQDGSRDYVGTVIRKKRRLDGAR